MISKELLSEVLSEELNRKIKCLETDSNIIHFNIDRDVPENNIAYYTDEWNFVNIYELAHECKKWAFGKGYKLISFYSEDDGQPRAVCSIYKINRDCVVKVMTLQEDGLEAESIFKACEWIMEQNKENK